MYSLVITLNDELKKKEVNKHPKFDENFEVRRISTLRICDDPHITDFVEQKTFRFVFSFTSLAQ